MEVITFESQAYRELVEKIDSIAGFVSICEKKSQQAETENTEGWVDSYDVCTFLKISRRTLQRLRTSKTVSYSRVGGRTYYKISEISRLLESKTVRRSEECLQDLIKNHQLHAKQRQDIKPD